MNCGHRSVPGFTPYCRCAAMVAGCRQLDIVSIIDDSTTFGNPIFRFPLQNSRDAAFFV